jgi:predicted HTH transcriptional regulator
MERDPQVEAVIAKTVCGFLNGRGGTLLIGVDDEGEALGLAADLELLDYHQRRWGRLGARLLSG